MDSKITVFWWFVLSNLFNPIHCAGYCYYYYNYVYGSYTLNYCYYYYFYYYYSYSSIGTIVGAVIGGIVGFVILVTIVVIVCVKACKTTNHGRVIVHPSQPTVSYVHSTQNSYGGPSGYHPAPNPILPPPYQGPSAPPGPPVYDSVYPPNQGPKGTAYPGQSV
ncbi:uncharacterized protein LOC133194526 isoform X2 [Saccostrea echinata]|uniref:uncharacterized protein LOC133194526 isoform X2 n=1 Tax=Saccostrea echinata TaxID=191078 RepID=UPI002A8132A8|nr:uncharacterized protein LOC133194526 isoform X2 [Saccostrea echinata]